MQLIYDSLALENRLSQTLPVPFVLLDCQQVSRYVKVILLCM